MRTFLSVLGVIIGTMAVTVIGSAGEGLKVFVLDQVDAFGSDIVQIEIKTPNTSKTSASNATSLAMGVSITTLKDADKDAIKNHPNITNAYAAIMSQEILRYQNEKKRALIMGVSAEAIDVDKGLEIDEGRFFSSEEENSMVKAAVIGADLKENLFGDSSALGQYIKVRNLNFRVIGVLKKRGAVMGVNFDEMAYLPLSCTQKLLLGVNHVTMISAKMKDVSQGALTAEDLIDLMRRRHNISDPNKDDFHVTTMAEAVDMLETIFGGITLLLIALTIISLIVGGVGIMNVMYVGVSERTFEIGLRKSLGAKRKDILWQFLWEAVSITLLGSFLGILIGASLTFVIYIVAHFYLNLNWSFVLAPQSIILVTVFSISAGIIFGLAPARKAAGLTPLEALRN